jgi:uncharacterized protein (DUF433 family)
VAEVRFDRITVDPGVLGGKPCIRGLRISVGMIVQMVASGKTSQQIVEEYPYLEVDDVQQALAYSAMLAESEYHLVLRPSGSRSTVALGRRQSKQQPAIRWVLPEAFEVGHELDDLDHLQSLG